MALSDHLLESSSHIREEIFRHPFVLGLGAGSLPVEKFRFYLAQDYRFLIEYCRVFGLAVAKADELADMSYLATLLNSTLVTEMELHREYSAGFAIEREALERTPIAATTRAYTSYLLSTAWRGGLTEIATSLLPCQWDYLEIAQRLAETGGQEEGNPYRQWVESYLSPEYTGLARWLRALVDRLGDGLGKGHLARLEEIFLASSRYELLFWNMAWCEE